jgi:hypothetical protein
MSCWPLRSQRGTSRVFRVPEVPRRGLDLKGQVIPKIRLLSGDAQDVVRLLERQVTGLFAAQAGGARKRKTAKQKARRRALQPKRKKGRPKGALNKIDTQAMIAEALAATGGKLDVQFYRGTACFRSEQKCLSEKSRVRKSHHDMARHPVRRSQRHHGTSAGISG